jgi:menaquinone-specific isochorismate synthase
MRAERGAARGQRLRRLVTRIDLDAEPLDLAGERGFAWRSAARELVAFGSAATIPLGDGPARLADAAEQAAAWLAAVETCTADGDPGDPDVPAPLAVGALPFAAHTPGRLTIPAVTVERGADGRVWASCTGAGDPSDLPDLGALVEARPRRRARPRVTAVRAAQDGSRWRVAVQAALAAIASGRLAKVVLARELEVHADRPFRRGPLLRRLAVRAPGGYVYASDGFLGASPELLVARFGRHALARPMAGTVPSGGAADEEARRLAWLRASAKNATEHRLVVDAVAAALGPVADGLRVAPVELVRLPTVAHLATRIDADLGDPAPTALELAALLHPTPAVAGTPQAAALAAIAELEPFERGCYAGPVGWVDARGDGEWAVALRCAALDGPRARLWAGAGIVAGSDPESEWYETEAKLAAMLGVLTR